MTTLLFDTTNILFRSMFAAQGFGAEYFTYDSGEECSKLMRKLCTDCAQIIRTINPSRVVFCKDAKSWRKQITIEENEGYKGQRKKDEKINWENIYNVLDEFSKIMEKNGYINCYIDDYNGGAEADDCIALWCEQIYRNNGRAVIVSSDEDIRQLVKSKNEDGKYSFITVFNPFKQGKNASKKIYHADGMIEWINKPNVMSLFDMTADGDKDDFARILNDPDIKFEYIVGKEIALRKLLCGDNGDNIPAFYTWNKVTAKGKEAIDRITNSKYIKILENLQITSISDFDDEHKLLALQEMIETFAKGKMNCDVFKRFERQRALVELDSKNFPEHIVAKFNSMMLKDMARVKGVTNSMSVRMQDLLKGTMYLDDNYSKGTTASIFKDVDRISKLF